MHGFEEMLGAQPYLHILSDAVVDHQRAQQGGFRLDIARQAFFRRVLRGNQSYILGHVLSSAHCAKETRGTLLYAVYKPLDKSGISCGSSFAVYLSPGALAVERANCRSSPHIHYIFIAPVWATLFLYLSIS